MEDILSGCAPPDKILHPVITKARNYISSLRHGRHGPPGNLKRAIEKGPYVYPCDCLWGYSSTMLYL